ncbi:hypothetical protein CBER1_05847 [Cercospora berteroae]|uniref:Uncharacterized protein n=1 Tax=Cercospora berteroae TaxID=357750 RepID=A0A2S6C2J2_9PEZI|nr:hypothetical protein CBER1_05847 [Cercospora berteroae]
MASPNWPLQDGPLSAADSNSPVLQQQNPSESAESFHMLDHLDSPQLTLHEFHKFQQSPVLAASPELESRRIRRKPSAVNLATAHARYTDPAAYCFDDPWTPSLILPRSPASASLHDFSPASSQHRPLTPRPRTYTASPSLSSTVDTLQSSPFQTPLHQGCSRAEHEEEDRSDFGEPIRTKRGGGSGSGGSGELWEVYAAVFEIEDVGPVVVEENLKKVKSVRFDTGTGNISEALAEDSQNTREEHPTSATSLSRIDWPLPPSHYNWQGTFGHLDTSTPPSTPATVLYRGASFDVLNPHASLILGSRSLETPAEIEGLLDSYFQDHEANMQPDQTYDEPPSGVSGVPSEHSRRVLYDNASDARRKILHMSYHDKGLVTTPPRALLGANAARKGERPFSDPFDLTLSDSDSHSTLMTINHVLKEGRRQDVTPPARMQPLGLGITDSDETHATSEQTTDPTIKAILEDYEYTRAPSSQPEDRSQERDVDTSPSIEYGRGGIVSDSSYERRQGLLSPMHTPDVDSETPSTSISNRSRPQPLLSAPLPVYRGVANCVPGGNWRSGYSSVPTSEQSYGNTSNLLNITPHKENAALRVEDVFPCRPATCRDPAHIHVRGRPQPFEVYEETESDRPPSVRLVQYPHDDKENFPPDDYESPIIPEFGMHGDTEFRLGDAGFRFPDLEVQDNNSDAGDLGRVMPRSSSYYPDDGASEWVTEYGVSQMELNRGSRLSAVTVESYADISDDGSEQRFSLPPAPPQTPVSEVVDEPEEIPAPKAVRLLGESKDKVAADEDIDNKVRYILETRIRALESKIADEQVNSKYTGSPKIDATQRRAELAELERLRTLLPSDSRPLMMKASESMTTIKASAQAKLQKAKTFVRPQYQPWVNFSRAVALGRHEEAFNSGSDTRGLLASPSTPLPYTNMAFNESTGTFMTVNQESPLNTRGPATNLWSPFDQDPTHRAIHVKSPIGKKPNIIDIELGPVRSSKSKGSQRAAIGSQYEPRDLHLVKTKRMSDAQLAARSAGWTMFPRQQGPADPVTGGGGSTPWSSSSTYPMLLKPESEMERDARLEQKRVSKRFLFGCAAFPPFTLLFGLGFFDRLIAKRSGGRFKEACPSEKRNALIVFFPLGMIFWAVCILVLLLVIILAKGKGGEDSSPFGA